MRLISTILSVLLAASALAVDFTPEEKVWMEKNPVIYFGFDPNWKPLEFLDNGKHVGVSRD